MNASKDKLFNAKLLKVLLISISVFAFAPNLSEACTVCSSETGQLIRQEIWGEDFTSNLLMTATPFPVVLALATLLFRFLPDFKTKTAVNHKPPEKKESYE